MTDHDQQPSTSVPPRLLIDRTPNGESSTTQRLAMNRTGSFEWDVETGTLDMDDAGLLVFGLDPQTFDSRLETLLDRLEPSERTRLDMAINEAIRAGRSSYSVHFLVPTADGRDQWTHIQARILRSDDGEVQRVVGVVQDATAEVTHSAFVLDLEKRRQRQTSIVERTTSALSHAVTVDDVTAALTGPGALARLGADGLSLGLVENTTLSVALSGDSLEAIDALGDAGLDRRFPLADTVLSGRPRFLTSVSASSSATPVLAPVPTG